MKNMNEYKQVINPNPDYTTYIKKMQYTISNNKIPTLTPILTYNTYKYYTQNPNLNHNPIHNPNSLILTGFIWTGQRIENSKRPNQTMRYYHQRKECQFGEFEPYPSTRIWRIWNNEGWN